MTGPTLIIHHGNYKVLIWRTKIDVALIVKATLKRTGRNLLVLVVNVIAT